MDAYSRTRLLLGQDGMEKLKNARVAVFGLGGVGGYVVEALVRSGIGALDLIDDSEEGVFYVRGRDGEFRQEPLTQIREYEKDDMEHVGWYYIPVKAGKPVWLTPYLNKNTGVTMISYVVPLYEQDKLLGVAGMDIDFDYISKVVSEIKIYDSGSAVLADAEGNVLVHDKECNGYEEQADFGVHLAVENYPDRHGQCQHNFSSKHNKTRIAEA